MTTHDLTPTPGQTIGPFFGYFNAAEQVHLPFEDGDNLVPPADDRAIQLTGTVFDGEGTPIPDAMIEIWQADEHGDIPKQDGSLIRDPFAFTGWGRGTTDNVGTYRFTTVQPGATDEGKAPFIHIVVFARGLLNKLHTRAYIPETEGLENDATLSALGDRAETLIAKRDGKRLIFDIHLQGNNETVFFSYPGMDYPKP
ncbi:MAG: protocatechuate 3,4-dioxygenase subunit alpha [Yaniella sp.]|nr:protocatechuate 3,4-dioxygenase subunit alpha [Yaniella sp.]